MTNTFDDTRQEMDAIDAFTPVGDDRLAALASLRRCAEAIAGDDPTPVGTTFAAISLQHTPDRPTLAHAVGVGLELMDTWSRDPELRPAIVEAHLLSLREGTPQMQEITEAAMDGEAFIRMLMGPCSSQDLEELAAHTTNAVAACVTSISADPADVPRVCARLLLSDAETAQVPDLGRLTPESGLIGDQNARTSQRDKRVQHAFSRWLATQDGVDEYTVVVETFSLTTLFLFARRYRIDPHRPEHAEALMRLVMNLDFLPHMSDETLPDEGMEQDEDDMAQDDHAMRTAIYLQTLDDYLHYQLRQSDDQAWSEAHAMFAEALHTTEAAAPAFPLLSEVPAASPEEQRAAMARTRIIAAVPQLLGWVGPHRGVTESGAIRRRDLETTAAFLGIEVETAGRQHMSRRRRRTQPGPEASARSAPPHTHTHTGVRAMADVPVLAAWWETLRLTRIVEIRRSGARHGAMAPLWRPDVTAPYENMAEIIGLFTTATLLADLRGPGLDAATPGIELAAFRLLHAIVPDHVDPPEAADQRASENADAILAGLHQVGLVDYENGNLSIPYALQYVVAAAALVALSRLDPEVSGNGLDGPALVP